MPNPFYTYKQFYFKQFILAWVHSLDVKMDNSVLYLNVKNTSISSNSVLGLILFNP